MKKMSNTTAIMIVAIGLFIIVSTVAIIVRIYEIGGTKKDPLFAGELEETIDFLSSNNLREYVSKVGIEYGATTYLRNFYCEIGPHFRVERLEFSIDSLISKENIRLFRYNREEARTVIENLPQNLAVIKVSEGSEVTPDEAENKEEPGRLTVEQFGDALRFYLPTKGGEGPSARVALELRVFKTREELEAFVNDMGASVYTRRDGQYEAGLGEDAGSFFLYETRPEADSGPPTLYELEYY